MNISIVIPCYRSEKTLPGVIREIDQVMDQTGETYEIILVNDGSPDGTWETIRRLCAEDKRRRGICFARNFGQHAALMAGIRASKGEIVLCMDDDGQTPPGEAPKLLAAIRDGADVVYASYGGHKQHSVLRNFGTAMNEKMTNRNYMGSGKQNIISLVVFGVPITLGLALKGILGEMWMAIIVLTVGVAFMLTSNLWIMNVYKRFMKRRYINMEGFRDSRQK